MITASTSKQHDRDRKIMFHTTNIEHLFQYAANGNISALQAYSNLVGIHQRQHQCQCQHQCQQEQEPGQQNHMLLWRCRNKDGASLLHYAAGNGHYDVCQFLLLQQQKEIVIEKEEREEEEEVGELLSNVKSIQSQRTALHWAARNGHLPIVKLLVAVMKQQQQQQCHNINNTINCDIKTTCPVVDIMAKGMVTPLQLCVWQGHVECTRWLIEQGCANTTLENGWGCTLAHWLAKSPIYAQAIDVLEDSKRKNNEPELSGTGTTYYDSTAPNSIPTNSTVWTRMWTLCDYFQTTLNMDWTFANHQGQTPLHKAAFAGNMPVLTYLVHHLRLLDSIRDNQSLLAADCAERGRQFSTANWLRLQASPWLWKQSYDILFGEPESSQSSKRPLTTPPSISDIKQAYRRQIQLYHPDRQQQKQQQKLLEPSFSPCHTKNSSSSSSSPSFQSPHGRNSWSNLQDAYTLWMAYWTDPLLAADRIRQQTRHAHLQQLPPLLKWYNEWHETEQEQQQQQQQMHSSIHQSRLNAYKCLERSHKTPDLLLTTTTCQQRQQQQQEQLQNFKSNLIRLLQTLPQQRVALSQLPKEYNKTYHHHHQPIMDIKTLFQCKNLGYFLEKYCHTNVEIVYGPKNNPSIQQHDANSKHIIQWVQLRTKNNK
jgi:ankyrin repeat protein